MVTQWLLNMIASAWEAIIGGIPAPSTDSWLGQVGTAVSWVANSVAGLGAWLPFSLIGAILGTLAAVWLVGSGIRIARMALSLFTGGGGNA